MRVHVRSNTFILLCFLLLQNFIECMRSWTSIFWGNLKERWIVFCIPFLHSNLLIYFSFIIHPICISVSNCIYHPTKGYKNHKNKNMNATFKEDTGHYRTISIWATSATITIFIFFIIRCLYFTISYISCLICFIKQISFVFFFHNLSNTILYDTK